MSERMKSNDEQASGKDQTLKACPFCGSVDVETYCNDTAVICNDCHAHGPITDGECRVAWNRRSSEPTTECCIEDVAHANPEPSDGRALFIQCDKHKRREKLADGYYPEPTMETARNTCKCSVCGKSHVLVAIPTTEPAETFEDVLKAFAPARAAEEANTWLFTKNEMRWMFEAGRRSR